MPERMRVMRKYDIFLGVFLGCVFFCGSVRAPRVWMGFGAFEDGWWVRFRVVEGFLVGFGGRAEERRTLKIC